MYSVSRQVFSKHPAKLLYDIVNDTISYKDFVPFCTDSYVMEEQERQKTCCLVFSKGALSRSLITRNKLVPNEKIDIKLVEGDFSYLYGQWQFIEQNGGTLVTLDFEYEFNQLILQYTFGQLFKPLTMELIDVFCRRANELSVR